MAWQPTLKVTPHELTYRTKHYHDIRTVKDRQLICTSCGNRISIEAGNFHVHPVMGSLQCEKCADHYNDIEFTSDEEGNINFCRLCGSSSDLQDCTLPECKFAFCRKCIKRNANLSLLDVDTKKWKCFLCAPKPFWEVRAVCAVVMEALPKKIKKKISLNSSSKWSQRPLPHVRQQIERTNMLQKSLKRLCDEDDDESNGDNNLTEGRPSFGFKTFEKAAPSKKNEDCLQKKGLHKLFTLRSSEDSSADDLIVEKEIPRRKSIQRQASSVRNDSDNSSSELELLMPSKKFTKRKENVCNDSDSNDGGEPENTSPLVCDSGRDKAKFLSKKSAKRTRKKGSSQLGEEETISPENSEENYIFDKEDSISLKIHVIQILDEIKEVFESQVNQIKAKLNEYEISNVEEANSAMKQCTDTFQNLKGTIEKKKNNLRTFYTTWNESCKKRRVPLKKPQKGDKYNLQNSKETTQSKHKLTQIENDERSQKEVIQVSDCDVNEIFSDDECIMPVEPVDKSASRIKVVEKVVEDKSKSSNSDGKSINSKVINQSSPVLGSSKENRLKYDDEALHDKSTEQQGGSNTISQESRSDIAEATNEDRGDMKNTSNKKSDKNQVIERQVKDKTPVANSTLLNHPDELNDSLIDIFDSSSDSKNETKEDTTPSEKLESPNEESHAPILDTNKNGESSQLSTKRKATIEDEICTMNDNHRKLSATPIEAIEAEKLMSIDTQSDYNTDTCVEKSSTTNTEEKEKTTVIQDKFISDENAAMINPSKEGTPESITDVTKDKSSKKKLPRRDKKNSSKCTDSIPPAHMMSENDDSSSDVDTSCSTIILPAKELLPDATETIEKTSGTLNTSSVRHIEEAINPQEDKSDEDVEKAAKDALLDSNSDSSVPLIRKIAEKIDNVGRDKSDDDSDNRRTKKALLNSSNSGSSTSDAESHDVNTSSIATKRASSHKSNSNFKRRRDAESDNSVGSRVKRRRLRLDKNKYYKKDEKLRMRCYVALERLKPRVLRKFSRALKKSRQYQESKALKSLISLDGLEKKRTRKCINSDSSHSSDDHIPVSKLLKDAKNRRSLKSTQLEESLMDHLMKVENGENLQGIDENSSDNETPARDTETNVVPNEDLISEADRIAKDMLLNSDSDIEQNNDSDKSTNEKEERKKERSKRKTNKDNKDGKNSDSDEEKKAKAKKSLWKRDKLLTMKLSDSDNDIIQKKLQQKLQRKGNEDEESSDNSGEDIKPTIKQNTKRRRRRVMDSDSDVKMSGSDSSSIDSTDVEEEKEDSKKSDKKKKRKSRRQREGPKLSDSDSSIGEKKPKPKRKRIKTMDSDSDIEIVNSEGSPNKTGRKNIRTVLKDKQVADDTKQAAMEEEERLRRIAERQRVYNEMYEMRLAGEEKVDKLVLDFDPETKKELVVAHENLVKRLKPHQAEGIKFMWDACFESLERIKTSKGSGCILAHCMGLGKTLQVITLSHTLLTHDETQMKTIMVVCPLSTVLNWVNEFSTWLTDIDDEIEVYELTKAKKNYERKYILEQWHKTGGVLIIGYEMFRTLAGTQKNMRKGIKTAVVECLIDPGPDLVVCDEGHLLKNEETALSKCMKQIKTLRRIVLTGTPLQNNLIEYHCMVQFVKPNLLGTKKEFLNRFVNPITNGQFDNSTAYDVKLMKKRAHVLHKMLEGSVQRFDYSVLTPFLPPKQEYVIFVRLSDVQIKMYRFYLENFARRHTGVGGSLFADFQALQRIWTHPIVLKLSAQKTAEKKRLSSDSEGSLKDFIDDDTTSISDSDSSDDSSKDSDVQSVYDSNEKNSAVARRGRSNPAALVVEDEPEKKEEEEWWSQFLQPEHFDDIQKSSKLVLLFEILKECEEIGDKVLVFSQSLYSLSLIEEFLGRIDNATQDGTCAEILGGHTGSWSLGLDYFRLDGQSSAENRSRWCKIFNRPTNTRARLFLISTRAGGLGINLTAANRVIIFDASWNPSHDVQSIFRVYRFGQKKPCYVYRFLAAGTMEEKIYNRQVTKLSLSCRVVDEQQIGRHYSNNDLNELYKFEGYDDDVRLTLNVPKDRLLAEIFLKYKALVQNYHEHDSLLENKAEEELDEEERKQAWLEYEEEKKGKPPQNPMFAYQNNIQMQQYNVMRNLEQGNMHPQAVLMNDYQKLQELIRKDYPNTTEEQQKKITTRALMEMYQYYDKQVMYKPTGPQMMPVRMMMPNTVVVNSFQQQQQQQHQHQQNSEVSQLMQHLQPNVGQHMNYGTQNVNKNLPGAAYTITPQNTAVYRNVPTTSRSEVDNDVVEIPTNTSNVTASATVQCAAQSANKGKEE